MLKFRRQRGEVLVENKVRPTRITRGPHLINRWGVLVGTAENSRPGHGVRDSRVAVNSTGNDQRASKCGARNGYAAHKSSPSYLHRAISLKQGPKSRRGARFNVTCLHSCRALGS